jgi:hypothetical protein
MKTSELIALLQEKLAQHGDREVATTYESVFSPVTYDGVWLSKDVDKDRGPNGVLLIDAECSGDSVKRWWALDPKEGEEPRCATCRGSRRVPKPPIFVEERAAYEAAKERLLGNPGYQEGDWVLIHRSEIVGVFANEGAALRRGYEMYGGDAVDGRPPFMIHELRREERVVYMPRIGAPPDDPCPTCSKPAG